LRRQIGVIAAVLVVAAGLAVPAATAAFHWPVNSRRFFASRYSVMTLDS